jgi:excisionase family DNA binding protein
VNRFLKAKAIAERYDLGITTVYQWGQKGVCPSVKVGTSVRYPEIEFDEWFREHMRGGKLPESAPAA